MNDKHFIKCKAFDGVPLEGVASQPWRFGEPVRFLFLPAGVSTVNAHLGTDETITCTVNVDESTAADLQESFDYLAATNEDEALFVDEDHEERRAMLRFPKGKVRFEWGRHGDGVGVVVTGAIPTSAGAAAVNGKVFRSFSPVFRTDADTNQMLRRGNHVYFPPGVKGSFQNPARIVSTDTVLGGLTNSPAFKTMPAIRCRSRATPLDAVLNCRDREIAALGDMQRRESERRGHEFMKWFTAHKN